MNGRGRWVAVVVSAALVVAGVQLGSTASVTPTSPAAAADAADFDPGMIISDEVFYNSSAMTASQVQDFLNARVPTCSSGYVCLKDYRQSTQSQPARAEGCAPYTGRSSESAAQIIANVATACGINPQALIVLLEKEQGIVSDATPSERQYRVATGYACPDTAACDAVYYGFFNQLYHAAWQFKKYRANPSIRAYQAGRINTIQWHPNTACGSSQLYIANQATAGLYIYTPYRPNAAALANLYGVGDSCSSYGNRNFWRMFTDWFGSTRTASVVMRPVNTSPVVYAIDWNGAFRVYPGDGRGSWNAPYQTGVGWGGMRHVDGAGDLDGDGNRDVIGLDSAGALLVYATDGLGAFTRSAKVADGYGGATAVFGAGDFNTDGANDLIVRDAAGDLLLLAGTGTGQFAPPRRIGNGWAGFTVLGGGVDVNGDRRPDVIARHPSGQLWLYPGDGRAGWGTPSVIGTGWNGMTAVFSPGDFDGDGAADVLAVDSAARMWLYPGSGGALSSGRLVGTGWGGARLVFGGGPVASAGFTMPAGIGDLTGNGSSDVIAVAVDGTSWLYATNGRGGWSAIQAISLGVTAANAIFGGGDFDRDGRRDVFVRDAAGDLWRLPSDGASGFGAPVRSGNGWGGFDAVFSPGDANGDTFSDVVGRDGDGRLWLYAGDGAGGFRSPVQIGFGWQGMRAVFSPGDFDGDGRSDVMAVDAAGSLLLYPGTGGGNLLAPKKIGHGWSGMTAVLSPGDFDGDLEPDVLARGADGSLWLYPGNGTGGWGVPRQVGSGWSAMRLIS